jgi:DNA-binding CsgD family transcriptional regulator
MTLNRIPAGLLDKGTEFFTVIENNSQKAKCIHGGKAHCFQTTPACRKEIVRLHMKANPIKEKAMEAMVGFDEDRKLEKYIMCNYGALNDEADINERGVLSEPEYVPCPNRNNCEHQGKGCGNVIVNGVTLSAGQTRVFKLVYLSNKEIADRLFLSVETVKKHMQVTQDITGLIGKGSMIHYATIKGII